MSEPPHVLRESLAGRYDVERELGEGGMATVYLAHDVRHGRMVAIKVIRPELVGMLGTDRFLAEIKLTARLQHPHILGLIDSGVVRALDLLQQAERDRAFTLVFLPEYPMFDGVRKTERYRRLIERVGVVPP